MQEVFTVIFKPSNISPDNLTFPSDEDIEIVWKNNGDLMVAYEIIVRNMRSNTVEYSSGIVDSYTPKHIIPSGALSYGIEYKYTITVYNSQGASATSDSIVLRCSARPDMFIDSDGYIRNQIATVYASYYQVESVPMKAYKFILYDEFQNVLEQSDYLYDGLLSYTFRYMLEDDTEYYVECVGVTQYDVLGTSGLVKFVADYIPPTVHFKLTTETYPDKPYVRLMWNTVRILGKTEGNISFGDSKINVQNGKVYFDDGFSIERDFSFKVWVDIDSIEDNEIIAQLSSNNARVDVMIYANKVHAFKYANGYTFHVASDIQSNNEGNQYFICLQQISRDLNVTCEVV